MGSRSFHCWLATLGGLAVACILTTGCNLSTQDEISVEDQLVGSWKRQDGDVEIVLQLVDAEKIFQVFRGKSVYEGEWAVRDDALLMTPVIAKLSTGEQLYVRDLEGESLVPSYRIVSIQAEVIHLEADPGDGQPEAFNRIRYDARLVGEWLSQDGGRRMTFHRFDVEKGYGEYELSRGSDEFRGQWRLAGKALHLKLAAVESDSTGEADVQADVPVSYHLISVQSDALRLDPGDGEISTYARVVKTQERARP